MKGKFGLKTEAQTPLGADRLRRVRAARFISAKGGPPGGANSRRRPGWGGRKKPLGRGRQAAGSFAGEPLWEQGLPF